MKKIQNFQGLSEVTFERRFTLQAVVYIRLLSLAKSLFSQKIGDFAHAHPGLEVLCLELTCLGMKLNDSYQLL